MKIKTEFGQCEYEFEIDYVHIYNLFVHPDHRRKGHARELLILAITSIRDAGYVDKIKIVADPTDGIGQEKLAKFYEKMGLEVYTCYVE
jgi:ribosomal protein S18 acetylase RimI-like enzyme